MSAITMEGFGSFAMIAPRVAVIRARALSWNAVAGLHDHRAAATLCRGLGIEVRGAARGIDDDDEWRPIRAADIRRIAVDNHRGMQTRFAGRPLFDVSSPSRERADEAALAARRRLSAAIDRAAKSVPAVTCDHCSSAVRGQARKRALYFGGAVFCSRCERAKRDR